MRLAIMQPYFMPYIGYFQLMNTVDKYVLYDNIEYTKKGWINRNRILVNGKDKYITIPVEKGSDFLDVKSRFISSTFDKKKLLNQLKEAYVKAPFYKQVFPILEHIINYNSLNLFDYIYNSILTLNKYLNIETKIIVSSSLRIDHKLKGQDKVIAICRELDTSEYINSIGGIDLYSKKTFKENNILLNFIKTKEIIYKQFNNDFCPYLSIIDVMMFNSPEDINKMLDDFIFI